MKNRLLKLKKLNPSGDTIIEVMIVLAILGLSFSISYATANQGVRKARNAQEHSIALGMLNGQVELIREAFAQKVNLAAAAGVSDGFCLPNPSNPAEIVESYRDDEKEDPNPACTQRGIYQIDNSYVPADGAEPAYFKFHVTWPGLATLGQQQETISYKIAVLANATNGWRDNVSPTTDPEDPEEPEDTGPSSPYQWTIAGANFQSCETTKVVLPDAYNGCFVGPTATGQRGPADTGSMHAWRNFRAQYMFASGSESIPGFVADNKPYLFVMAYQQFRPDLSFPAAPPGYKFNVTVTIYDSGGLTGPGGGGGLGGSRGGSSAPSSGNILATFTAQLTMGNDGVNNYLGASSGIPHYAKYVTLSGQPRRITIEWTNNEGGDPNLEILNLQLGRGHPGAIPPVPAN